MQHLMKHLSLFSRKMQVPVVYLSTYPLPLQTLLERAHEDALWRLLGALSGRRQVGRFPH